jgi:hypothetical protein
MFFNVNLDAFFFQKQIPRLNLETSNDGGPTRRITGFTDLVLRP